jgi:hypothetical protein
MGKAACHRKRIIISKCKPNTGRAPVNAIAEGEKSCVTLPPKCCKKDGTSLFHCT